ncbi:transglycosylase SLT domain-containing protein [Xenorhabdus sp. DI]|uniref:transglycosylase SLT domain-containing protein n=1 Tax=Xenorhabdus doucetiae TaxID=351671 RepID=UPI00198FA8F5|nr:MULTISPECIES: transglycosylase SLT domain-containing protein [unclassified Xenorhabdus]MBD2785425.1 transglycosylase SLT domain-containing protein [Xenorhabdus sp. 3]MBD2788846.1 transglycosylase SLT domain-containing protein [Xenorhabdus sp. DI]
MKLKFVSIALVLLLTGCAGQQGHQSDGKRQTTAKRMPDSNNAVLGSLKLPKKSELTPFDGFIQKAAKRYGIDETLIKAIIQVESGFRPEVISKSNAVGLMQIKASTAGRDAYRMKGKSGQPTVRELKDPETNIDLGTAYISILRKQHLEGISNPETLYYATIVAYVNGAGALLRTFDSNRTLAINKINRMTPNEFYQYVQNNHPAPQASRYLWKVKNAYRAFGIIQ